MVFGSVLVTGANRGIGLSLVKQLLLLPDVELILATCRSPNDAKDLQETAKENAKVQILQLDISNAESIKNAAKVVEEKVAEKGLNMLINNAGILRYAPKGEELTGDKLMENYATNAVAPLMVTQAFLPLLEKAAETKPVSETAAKNAVIVNISSVGGSLSSIQDLHRRGLDSLGNALPYFCSKAALNMITRCVAVERPNLTVVAVHPGWVITDMGGPSGLLTGDQSASSIVKTLQNLKSEHTGCFINWEGQPVPW